MPNTIFGTALRVFITDRDASDPAITELINGRRFCDVKTVLAAIIRMRATSSDRPAPGLLIELVSGDLVHVELTPNLWNMVNQAVIGAEMRQNDQDSTNQDQH